MRVLCLLPLLACNGDKCGSDGRFLSAVPADALPASAPGVTLLAALGADGRIVIGGTVQAEVYVDLDGPSDDRYPFRYQVLDATDAVLYERTTSGPIIVRDFLAYYGDLSGYELLEILPALGTFPIIVPLIEGGVGVNLQLRDDDGAYRDVGSYDLSRVEADDQGLSEVVAGAETLWESGPPENRLDIVLMGDGYTLDQLDGWRTDAQALAETLLAAAPFSDYADAINIHRVDTVSDESGASYDCIGACEMRDTALQTFFPLELVNSITGSDYRSEAVFQLDQWGVARAASTVPWDAVIVIANTEHDGGFAVHYATATRGGARWETTAVHEFGHALGLLGDEYTGDFCIRSGALGLPENITDTPDDPLWRAWIAAETPLPTPEIGRYEETVGAYAEAYNCADLYRPAQSCRMLDSNRDIDFCPVCMELVTRRLFRHGDPAEGVDVVEDADGGLTFTVRGARADAGIEWEIDGASIASDTGTFTLGPDEGAGRLVVRVALDPPTVRAAYGDLEATWAFDIHTGGATAE